MITATAPGDVRQRTLDATSGVRASAAERLANASHFPSPRVRGEGAQRADEGQFATMRRPQSSSLSTSDRVLAFGLSRRWGVPREVSTASRRPSHFLLLVQEKVTKEKDTPVGPPFGHPVLRVREPVPGFADDTSCVATNTRTSVSASLRADPSPSHRASRGPVKAAAILAVGTCNETVLIGAMRWKWVCSGSCMKDGEKKNEKRGTSKSGFHATSRQTVPTRCSFLCTRFSHHQGIRA